MSLPRITKIERQKRAQRRVSIFLDDEFAFGVNEEIAYRFQLAKGMELTPELRSEIERADGVIQAKLAAERLFAGRRRSEKELRQRLARKGFSDEVIDEVIAGYSRVGLIDDEAFALAYVKDRLNLKPRARSVLQRELTAKGISKEIITRTLDSLTGSIDEEAIALQLAEKKRTSFERFPVETQRRRLTDFLLRRGFSFDVVKKVMGKVMEDYTTD